MEKRFVAIWFRYLKTDWFARRQPSSKQHPFVLAAPDHGRMVITDGNAKAESLGIFRGMTVADARALYPSLKFMDDQPALPQKLLKALGEWCIRYSPFVSIDFPDGLVIDATGCAHLCNGEEAYITDIHQRLHQFGYTVQLAMADTVGASWAFARYGEGKMVIKKGDHPSAILSLPAAAIRPEKETLERLQKLGLHRVNDFISIPRTSLRRRFGTDFIKKINLVLGAEEEILQPVVPLTPYAERFPCFEPIITRTGIEMALQQLLETICTRLQ
ncbi:MAG TPA: DNA polymerase Y family protein, partial [Chitinophagaceae bacterium]|nr:DNA polymerase Y family protein [Chitinophagaceae bacterium]